MSAVGEASDRLDDCPLCRDDGGSLIYRASNWRVVLVHEPLFPGFTRVIWNAHRREMSDLAPAERDELLQVVLKVETRMREVLVPDKINLASLGNEVDHVHWHVIPRWRRDSHFPRPVWAAPIPARKPAVLVEPARLTAWRTALTGLFDIG